MEGEKTKEDGVKVRDGRREEGETGKEEDVRRAKNEILNVVERMKEGEGEDGVG